MSNNSGFFVFCFLILQLLDASLCAQNTPPESFKQQLELSHDNDFFLFTDRYYSSGLFLTYRRTLQKGIVKDNSEQLDITIGQEVYTPSQTQSTNTALFDRTYAGFAGLRTAWSISGKKNQLFKTEFLVGIAGLNSGSGGLQRWFHRVVNILDSPLWVAEIEGSLHLNAYFTYVKEWKIAPQPFGVNLALIPNLAFGSRDIYVEPETVLYFGRRNSVDKSIAYSRIGSTDKELYFALRTAYRYVIHNGLIEGNLFGDNSLALRESSNTVWRFELDFYHRFKRNDYKFGVRYNTRETQLSRDHKFIMLSYGLRF